MADPRFFEKSGPKTLLELAEIAEAEVRFGSSGDVFDDVQALQDARANHVSFLDNKLYASDFKISQAGVCLVEEAYADQAPKGMALLITSEPYRAYARVAAAFYPKSVFAHKPDPFIHAAAHIDPSASLGDGCRVEAGAVIGAGVEIGEGCSIGANTTLADNVVLGEGCSIGANVTLQCVVMGSDCVVHPGARIGQDGFGFAPGAEHLKVPQLGIVRIGDKVDIGANACIDRGTGPDTVIESGTKIDNMVQIAHNVEVGKGCLFPAHTGISGSTKIGNYVMIGGGSGLAGHLTIGDGARIAAHSGVMRDIKPGETVAGYPAFPAKEFWRQLATLRRLSRPKKGAKP